MGLLDIVSGSKFLVKIQIMNKPDASQRVELLRSAPLNTWLALSADETRIIATGKTFMEADEAAEKTGEQDYFLTKTPHAWLPRAILAI
jgi:hypothetical protein